MPRHARIYTKSEVYHIIMRGNNKQNLFYTKQDRYFFINRMKKYAAELHIELYAYCLMTNHVHILVGKANSGLSKLIQKIANSYVYYFNKKYNRSGHLFQGRFKSEPVNDNEYFKKVFRYILKNPEKAGLSSYKNYKWNSFKNTIEPTKNNVLSLQFVIDVFGSLDHIKNFLLNDSKEICMEYQNKFQIDDKKAKLIIKNLLKIQSLSSINCLEIQEQIEYAKTLKLYGFPCNQISRITGINRKILSIA